MGNFGGHALPGSFFILFALWWTVQTFHRFFKCKQRNSRFYSSTTFPCTCLCGRLKDWPMEAVVKILFVCIGFSLEIYTAFRDGKFVILGNGQHATMFFFFGMTGFADILKYFKAPVPQDVDYAFYWLAVFVEGLLFKFHLHGRDELNTLLHTLLIYTIAGCALGLMAEMRWRHNVMISLTKTYFLFLQGTWFWQVGFILYNPSPGAEEWDPHNHDNLMIATMIYAWHCGAVLLIMLSIGGVIGCFHRQFGNRSSGDISMKRLINTGSNGQTFIAMSNDDSDESDTEFQKGENIDFPGSLAP